MGAAVVTVAVVLSVTSLTLSEWTSPTAAALSPECTGYWSRTLVGVPLLDGGRGAIELRMGADRKVLTRSALGLGAPMPGDRFGAAVQGPFDLDGDDCSDFVVGAPGVSGTGAVYVLQGSPEGVGKAYEVRLPGARRGDRFGHSLTVSYFKPVMVVAGAPGGDVRGASDAGVIAWFRPSITGPGEVKVLSQATPGVAGTAESGDRFGEVLSRPFAQREEAVDVVVGVPHEDVGSAIDAGIAEQVNLTGDGSGPSSIIYRQRAGEPLGVPERGDQFGSSIVINDDIDSNTLAVGVPGEDVGTAKNAGAVNLLTDEWGFPDDVHYHPRRAVTQQSARVPGRVETGDRFGASLEASFYCALDRDDESTSASAEFAIGAPGEDLGGIGDAGTVTLYDTGLSGDGTPIKACPSHLIRQDGLAQGRAEAGDRLGADLGSRYNELLVAVPGEDVRGAKDAGLVAVIDDARFEQRPAEQFSRGPRSGLRYATLP